MISLKLHRICHTRLIVQSSRCRGRRRTRNSALSQRCNWFTLRESDREVKRAEFCDRLIVHVDLLKRTSVRFQSVSELALQHKWPRPTRGFRANWLAKSDQGPNCTRLQSTRAVRLLTPLITDSMAHKSAVVIMLALMQCILNLIVHNLPCLTGCNNLCLCDMGTSSCAFH